MEVRAFDPKRKIKKQGSNNSNKSHLSLGKGDLGGSYFRAVTGPVDFAAMMKFSGK